MPDGPLFVQVDLVHDARKRCRECGRLRSVRMFTPNLNCPDYRNPLCDDCEEHENDDPPRLSSARLWA